MRPSDIDYLMFSFITWCKQGSPYAYVSHFANTDNKVAVVKRNVD